MFNQPIHRVVACCTNVLAPFLLANVLLCPATLMAQVIFNDTFSRTGPVVGSTADTGQIWSGTGAFATNGSELLVDSNNAPRVGISFAPNTTYELSLDITIDSGDWIAFGYTDIAPVNSWVANTGAMAMAGSSSTILQVFDNGMPAVQQFNVSSVFPKTLSIVLDTGATLTNSTLSYKVNGVPIGGTFSTDASSADGIFIQAHNSGRGPVDNFRLTAVPEPGSGTYLSLLMVGLVGGSWYRRFVAVRQ